MNTEIIDVTTRREWKKIRLPKCILYYSTNYEKEYWQISDLLLPSQRPATDPCPELD
jgi:hypothetical protein